LDAAAIRALISPRIERVIECALRGRDDRRCDGDDRCPPAEGVAAAAGPIPFDRFLEKRNREDTVEFSLGKSCPREQGMSQGPRAERGDRPEGWEQGRGRRGPGAWPRLGEVSPVEELVVRRRVETVYRVAATVQGGRIDLVG
jgi:hypothetical protein